MIDEDSLRERKAAMLAERCLIANSNLL